ncbi:MAG TPA: glutathione peroxidase [Cytophagaceae bacterium]
MSIKYSLILFFSSLFGLNKEQVKPAGVSAVQKDSFYQFKVKALNGQEVDFSTFKGKKVMIVNTASKCGFTPQYKELQQLHEKYKDKLVIIGFPANDFKNQEPGTNKEIQEFCQLNYGVTFQMMEKVQVTGKDKHPVYQWLTDKNQNGWNDKEPTWNFCKYLINEQGELTHFFPQGASPLSEEIIRAIESK